MYEFPLFLSAGDQALVVEFGDSIDSETSRRVHGLLRAVERKTVNGVIDLVPSYRSLLINYDPLVTTASELKERITSLDSKLRDRALKPTRVVKLPTLYGGEHGPDLEFVAEHTGLSSEVVVNLHSEPQYLVYMIGFSPGFPYLGGMPEQLATPRLETPRIEITAGSVGIAGTQTGVYPLASPGGWQLIGRTPVRMFDPDVEPPSVLKSGDLVQFVPLDSADEFSEIEALVAEGRYRVVMEKPA
jgi:KipI family sensor histidine kinase inhibitor